MRHAFSSIHNFIFYVFGRSLWITGCLLATLPCGCAGEEPMVQLPQEAQATQDNQVATPAPVTALDWPQIRGIGGAGIASGERIEPWGKDGPTKIWSAKVGAGFSSPIVFGKYLFMVHRTGGGSEAMTADLRFAETGKIVWRR